jgi:N-acyl-D-amino-acid deacylase
MDEEDVRRILAWPGTMIGSDSIPAEVHPHPRLWGAFPRLLGRYARELGLFSMEEAVRRITSLPAGRFGLRDRGVVREGASADLVVLDEARVADRSTFESPVARPDGIELVLVNGQAVWRQGAPTGVLPGRVLRLREMVRM